MEDDELLLVKGMGPIWNNPGFRISFFLRIRGKNFHVDPDLGPGGISVG